MRSIGLGLLLLVPLGCRSATAPRPGPREVPERQTCVVAAVADGDTFDCASGVRVRLLSVDAPELGQVPWGDSAREALRQRLPVGGAVILERDVQPFDDFGRLLAYVFRPDSLFVNEDLARAGYVVDLIYPPNIRYADRIRAAVENARENRRGLWASWGFLCLPRDFRAGRCR